MRLFKALLLLSAVLVAHFLYPFYFAPYTGNTMPFAGYIRSELFKRIYQVTQAVNRVDLFRSYVKYMRYRLGPDSTSQQYIQSIDLEISVKQIMLPSARPFYITEEQNSSPLELRVYSPTQNSDQISTLLVYYHGGGWAVNDLNIYDMPLRFIAKQSNAIVVAVNYRKAPESPFPAALNDCLETLVWALEHKSTLSKNIKQIIIAGDSGGGQLANGITLFVRDVKEKQNQFANQTLISTLQSIVIDKQVLIYPALYFLPKNSSKFVSHSEFADYGYIIDRFTTELFWKNYVGSKLYTMFLENQMQGPQNNPYLTVLTPMLENTSMNYSLKNVPPTLVITASWDLLRDEGITYCTMLQQAGVSCQLKEFEGQIHGFASGSPAAIAAIASFVTAPNS